MEETLGTYKIVLVGDGKTGKTTFVNKLISKDEIIMFRGKGDQGKSPLHKESAHFGIYSDLQKKYGYQPTLGVEVHPIRILTNHGMIIFNLWDVAGQEDLGGLRDGYYINAKGALIFFSYDDSDSFENMWKWERDLYRVSDTISYVAVGNKSERKTTLSNTNKVHVDAKTCEIEINEHETAKVVDISCSTGFNIKEPLLVLARILSGMDDLIFIE